MSQYVSLKAAADRVAQGPVNPHGLIRKLVVLACAIALPLALAASAQAVTVVTTVDPVDNTFTDETCEGLPLEEHSTGKRIQEKRYDDEGELVSWILHAPRISTLTNPVNGTTATGHQAFTAVFDPSKPVPTPLSISGLRFIVTAPQFGVVLLDAGRVEFGEGGIEFEAGKHQLIGGEVDAYCSYFESP